MGETRGTWEEVGIMLMLDCFGHVKKSEYPPEAQNCGVFRGQMTFGVCSGGHCVSVLVRDALSYMFVSVSEVFSIHNLSESVEMCSKAPPLTSMHNARRSSQSRSSRPSSWQERTATQDRVASALSAMRPRLRRRSDQERPRPMLHKTCDLAKT